MSLNRKSTAQARLVADHVAVIERELVDVRAGVEVARAVATIQQAAHMLRLALGDDMTCPEITHDNGQLVDRYLDRTDSYEQARAELAAGRGAGA